MSWLKRFLLGPSRIDNVKEFERRMDNSKYRSMFVAESPRELRWDLDWAYGGHDNVDHFYFEAEVCIKNVNVTVTSQPQSAPYSESTKMICVPGAQFIMKKHVISDEIRHVLWCSCTMSTLRYMARRLPT